MYSVSEEYKEAIEGSSCEFKIEARVRLSDNTQLLFDDSTITDDVEIRSRMISGSASGKKIDIGAVAPSTLEITVTDDSADLHRFSGARIDLSVYLKLTGGEFEKVKMGTFFSDNSKIKRYLKKITITAYDAMLSLQYAITADMRAELKNKTAQEAAQILTRYSRGTFSQDLTGFPNSDIFLNFDSRQIVTARDGIMWIAQLMGCFARFNRENHLEFVKIKSDWEMYDETTGTILAARNIRKRFKTTFSDDRMHIVGLSTRGADGKLVSVQSGGLSDDVNLTIELEQNPLITSSSKPTADILNAILSQVSTAYFYAFTSEIPNDPALDAGDTVRLQGGVINGTNQNNDLIGFITHNVWRYRGKHTITNAGQTPVLGAEAAQPAAASVRRKAAARAASASDAETDSTAVAAEAQADGAEALTYLPPKSQMEKLLEELSGRTLDCLVSAVGNNILKLTGNSKTDIAELLLLHNNQQYSKFYSYGTNCELRAVKNGGFIFSESTNSQSDFFGNGLRISLSGATDKKYASITLSFGTNRCLYIVRVSVGFRFYRKTPLLTENEYFELNFVEGTFKFHNDSGWQIIDCGN